MEVSAIKHPGAVGVHGRSPLLRLQTDERLIALVRRGNHHAYEALVARYQSRLLAFCRHMLGSREDAEDVLQEVFAAAFNAIQADERPINARPWLYRIARNRSLNHLRRVQAIGVDSMDVHFSEGGQTTADKVHKREDFRLLIGDVQQLPESQRTALLLREIDALSYDQIAEAMETTVPSVKSLLVRARVSLAEAAEARRLTCEEVRAELGEVAEGLRRTSAPVRRHLRTCERCTAFRGQLKQTNRALAAVFPIGPLFFLKKLLLTHASTHAGSGGATAAGGSAVAGGGAAASGGAVASTGAAGGLLSATAGAIATKAAVGLAAAAIVTAGAVEVRHATQRSGHHAARTVFAGSSQSTHTVAQIQHTVPAASVPPAIRVHRPARHKAPPKHKPAAKPAPKPVLVASRTTPATPTLPTTHDAPKPAPVEQGTSTTQLPVADTQPSGATGDQGTTTTTTTTTTSGGATQTTTTTTGSGSTGSQGEGAGSSGTGSGSTGSDSPSPANQPPQGSPPPPDGSGSQPPQGSPPPPQSP